MQCIALDRQKHLITSNYNPSQASTLGKNLVNFGDWSTNKKVIGMHVDPPKWALNCSQPVVMQPVDMNSPAANCS